MGSLMEIGEGALTPLYPRSPRNSRNPRSPRNIGANQNYASSVLPQFYILAVELPTLSAAAGRALNVQLSSMASAL